MTLSGGGFRDDATGPGPGWLDTLGWRSACAFVGFVLVSGLVALRLLGELLDSPEQRMPVVVGFCGFLLVGGLLALAASWAGFRLSRPRGKWSEVAYGAALLAAVVAGGGAAWLTRPEPPLPVQSIKELLVKANQAYTEQTGGFELHEEDLPLILIDRFLDTKIRTYEDLLDVVEGEERAILEGLLALAREYKPIHLKYVTRDVSFNRNDMGLFRGKVDRVQMLQRIRMADEFSEVLRRYHERLGGFEERLTETLVSAGLDQDRAQSLAAGYTQSIELATQREFLKAYLRNVVLFNRNQTFVYKRIDRLELIGADDTWKLRDPEEHRAWVEMYNEYWGSYGEMLAIRTPFFERVLGHETEATPIEVPSDQAVIDRVAAEVFKEHHELWARANAAHEKLRNHDMLWPDTTRDRAELDARVESVSRAHEAALAYADSCSTVLDKLESKLLDAGVSFTVADVYVGSIKDDPDWKYQIAVVEYMVVELGTELELLKLYQRQFRRWYTNADGYVVFTDLSSDIRFRSLVTKFIDLEPPTPPKPPETYRNAWEERFDSSR